MKGAGCAARVPTALALALGLLWPAAAPAQVTGENKALGRPAAASSSQLTSALAPSQTCIPCLPGKANDGDPGTRWGSAFVDGQSWQVDLGSARAVDTVVLDWEASYASRYRIDTSLDGATYTSAAEVAIGSSGPTSTTFSARQARVVRVTGIARSDPAKGISIWEAQVLGPPDPPPSAAAAPSPPPAPATPPARATATARVALLSPFPIVRIRGNVTTSGTRVTLISVRAPRGAIITARCRGGGCPRTARRGSRGVTRLRSFEREFRPGTVIEVLVTRRGRLGKFTRFRIRGGRAPQRSDACARAGARAPTRCAAG